MNRPLLLVVLPLAVSAMLSPRARAEDAALSTTNRAIRALAGFLAPGGYFPTGGPARSFFGSSKWAGEMSLHAKPKRIGGALLSGGFDRFSASDRFLPFSGGNEYSLTGAGVRLTTEERVRGVRPFLAGGLFAGYLRCDALGVATTRLVPSGTVGLEWKVTRDVALSASYRLATPIGGLSMNGLGLYLRLY